MPLYEYACRSCADAFEVLQRIGADQTGLSCPACGGRELERQHSTFASGAATASVPGPAAEACPCGSPSRCGA
jgi:putative FmdB family regulatory protein